MDGYGYGYGYGYGHGHRSYAVRAAEHPTTNLESWQKKCIRPIDEESSSPNDRITVVNRV